MRDLLLRASSDRIVALSQDFHRLHAVASSPIPTPAYLHPIVLERVTTVCPSGLTEREKVHFMDEYLPNSSAHYGGSLPTSPFLQSQCVMVRSHHVWRNQRYALPAHLSAFRQFEAAAAAAASAAAATAAAATAAAATAAEEGEQDETAAGAT